MKVMPRRNKLQHSQHCALVMGLAWWDKALTEIRMTQSKEYEDNRAQSHSYVIPVHITQTSEALPPKLILLFYVPKRINVKDSMRKKYTHTQTHACHTHMNTIHTTHSTYTWSESLCSKYIL